ncbi:MAG TPA: CehA/McbA family metallohydrolase [Thermoplasmata archaeon]|nr:CehA/McbA family metallohydrolase [Thermoplasmata archaeon]
MILDLHNHTRYSPDSKVDPVVLVKQARSLGLAGIGITDHNAVAGARVAAEAAKSFSDFVVVPGAEVSTSGGHVLAYGVTEAIPRNLTPVETIERIVAAGGVPVAAHPYRFWSGLGEAATLSSKFVAYEVANARTLRVGNEKAVVLAGRTKVGRTGGSDSHFLRELGRGVTSLDRGATTVDDILQAIASGRTAGIGLHRGPWDSIVYVTKAVGEWLLRGMHRI